jgi:Rhodanese-related sulfurtransferase
MPLPEFKQICDEAKKEIKEIDVNELKRMQHDGQIALVDVREKDEQAQGMIPGAVGLSRGMLEYKIDTVTTTRTSRSCCTAAAGADRRWRHRASRRWGSAT